MSECQNCCQKPCECEENRRALEEYHRRVQKMQTKPDLYDLARRVTALEGQSHEVPATEGTIPSWVKEAQTQRGRVELLGDEIRFLKNQLDLRDEQLREAERLRAEQGRLHLEQRDRAVAAEKRVAELEARLPNLVSMAVHKGVLGERDAAETRVKELEHLLQVIYDALKVGERS